MAIFECNNDNNNLTYSQPKMLCIRFSYFVSISKGLLSSLLVRRERKRRGREMNIIYFWRFYNKQKICASVRWKNECVIKRKIEFLLKRTEMEWRNKSSNQIQFVIYFISKLHLSKQIKEIRNTNKSNRKVYLVLSIGKGKNFLDRTRVNKYFMFRSLLV